MSFVLFEESVIRSLGQRPAAVAALPILSRLNVTCGGCTGTPQSTEETLNLWDARRAIVRAGPDVQRLLLASLGKTKGEIAMKDEDGGPVRYVTLPVPG